MSSLTIKNKITELKKIIPLIDSFREEYSLSKGIIFDLNLAIDEICANIIHHGELEAGESIITIDLSYSDKEAVITIIDEGKEFNPLEYETYDINTGLREKPVGNLGILLVKSKMDEIFYRRSENKNILTMKKRMEN